jgi:alpha-L-rhamnosidase
VSGAAQTLALPAAAALAAGTTYTWRVRVWLSGSASVPTDWSAPAAFDTAPAGEVFPGKNLWLGGGGQMRAKQPLALPTGKVARARAFVTGMGAFYLFVNGVKVGENIMDPPQTVYSKTILYNTFDVAALLTPGGANHVGVLLGNYKWGYTDQWANMTKAGGPVGMRAVMMALEVTMEDGSTHTVDTSVAGAWEGRVGPILWDHFFHGETYDGSLDPEWTSAGADTGSHPAGHAQAWSPAVVISPEATAPTGMQVMPSRAVKPLPCAPVYFFGDSPYGAYRGVCEFDLTARRCWARTVSRSRSARSSRW